MQLQAVLMIPAASASNSESNVPNGLLVVEVVDRFTVAAGVEVVVTETEVLVVVALVEAVVVTTTGNLEERKLNACWTAERGRRG
jgi:hypothetical protein